MQLLFQLLCWTESLRQCPLHRCWWTTWTTRSKRRPTCSAQLHLPTHDLFWAKVRVQLHLPPLRSLDLLISPGAPYLSLFLCCLTSTEAGWPIRDGDRVGKRARVIGSTAETARKRPERPWTAARTMEVLRRCPLAIAQRLVHCAIALSTAVLDRVTKTMSVAPLLTNNLDNSKQKMSNLLSPAPPPYSWSLLGKSEGPAPPPSSKISRSFDLAWNPDLSHTYRFYIALFSALDQTHCVPVWFYMSE